MRRTALAALVLALATACGGDPAPEPGTGIAGSEPAEALQAAHDAMRALQDVTYRGTTTVNGPAGPLAGTGELVVTDDGTCQSSFEHAERGSLVTRTVGNTVYVFADVPMMRGPLRYDAEKVALLRGKWQAAPRPSSRSCDLAELLPEDSRFEGFEDAGTGQVRGAAVRRFTGTDDDGSAMTVSIATDGPPLLLAVETARGGTSSFELVAHDSGARIAAPPDQRIVNAS